MNVRELISELQGCDPEQFVYVGDEDGTIQIAEAVVTLPHLNIPAGMRVRIDDDVVIVTAAMREAHCRPPEPEQNNTGDV